ncbi:MAG: HAMP domain-containing protein, partial [Proteobacteria bacterium]
MTKTKITFSIRARIVLLVTGIVGLSVGVQAYFGVALFVDDKTSYLYQRDMTVLASIAERIENKINDALAFNNFVSVYYKAGEAAGVAATATPSAPAAPASSAVAEIEQLYQLNAKRLSITGLVLLERGPAGLAVKNVFGVSPEIAENILRTQGWEEASFETTPNLIGTAADGVIPLGTKIVKAGGVPVVAISFLKVGGEILAGKYPEMDVHLFDLRGHALLSQATRVLAGAKEAKEYVARMQEGEPTAAGVRKLTVGTEEYMAGYKKLSNGRLMAVSFVPSQMAFSAAQALIYRSIIVGFSIFLLAIGLAALLIKGLVVRLRQLWFATQRIAEGDFSSRIDTKGGGSDELAALAGSFNEMSGRISDLMEETAARARMAKELETAQAVQRGFFPKHPYLAPNLRLSGAYQPASECAGDWWGHAVHGDTVYVAIGDVT